MGKIFVLMGKSATGKDSIYKRLIESKEVQLKTVVLYTTRPKREHETNGVEYFFVDTKELLRLKEEHKIIEHRVYKTVHGDWNYFTVRDGQIQVEEANYLMIGTLEAYQQLKAYYGANKVVPIYIEVEDRVRIHRALEREDQQSQPKYLEMCRRFLADEEDFKEAKLRENQIQIRYQNLVLDDCVSQIIQDVKRIL